MKVIVYCDRGHRGRVRLPHSEVCMHMGVAGEVFEFEITERGSVQLCRDGRVFSSPITLGEAGVFCTPQLRGGVDDPRGRYYYYQ